MSTRSRGSGSSGGCASAYMRLSEEITGEANETSDIGKLMNRALQETCAIPRQTKRKCDGKTGNESCGVMQSAAGRNCLSLHRST